MLLGVIFSGRRVFLEIKPILKSSLLVELSRGLKSRIENTRPFARIGSPRWTIRIWGVLNLGFGSKTGV